MIASGYVGSNNGIKTTQTGNQYATFSIAADRREGETVWVNVKAWRNLALVADALRKGDCVLVTGRYEEHDYNGKTYKTLVADYIGKGAPASDAYELPSQAADGYGGAGATIDGADDELPF